MHATARLRALCYADPIRRSKCKSGKKGQEKYISSGVATPLRMPAPVEPFHHSSEEGSERYRGVLAMAPTLLSLSVSGITKLDLMQNLDAVSAKKIFSEKKSGGTNRGEEDWSAGAVVRKNK